MIGEYNRDVLWTNGVFNQRAVKTLAKEFKLNLEHSSIILNSAFYHIRGVISDPYDYRRIMLNGLFSYRLHKCVSDKSKTMIENRKEYKYKKFKEYSNLLEEWKASGHVKKRIKDKYAKNFIKYAEGEPYVDDK